MLETFPDTEKQITILEQALKYFWSRPTALFQPLETFWRLSHGQDNFQMALCTQLPVWRLRDKGQISVHANCPQYWTMAHFTSVNAAKKGFEIKPASGNKN